MDRHSTASLGRIGRSCTNPHGKIQLDDWRNVTPRVISIHEGSGRSATKEILFYEPRGNETPTEYWRVFIAIELPNYVPLALPNT